MRNHNPVEIKTLSDLHFSHAAPLLRQKEPDWYLAMERAWAAVGKADEDYCCPDGLNEGHFVYPGDIFDDGWRPHRCPPELINFARRVLPHGYAIPGQHDLPHHRLDDIEKSAYYSLNRMSGIYNLKPGQPERIEVDKGGRPIWLFGFPWGVEVQHPDLITDKYVDPCFADDDFDYGKDPLKVAVIHAMCWTDDTGYVGAKGYDYIDSWRKRLHGYDVAIFGDNHKGFVDDSKKPFIINNGTFMVRRRGEEEYPPHMGLVYRDGSVKRVPLDTSGDVYDLSVTQKDEATTQTVLSNVYEKLVKSFEGLSISDAPNTFEEEVMNELRAVKEISESTRSAVLRLIGGDHRWGS